MGMESCPAYSWSSLIITITVSHEGACVCVQGSFLQNVIRTLCVLGVGMIMGDGVLTPAISVVSAIEGLGNIPGGGGNISRSQSPQSHSSLSVLCISGRTLSATADTLPAGGLHRCEIHHGTILGLVHALHPLLVVQDIDLLCCPRNISESLTRPLN